MFKNIQLFFQAVTEGFKIGLHQQRIYISRLFVWLIASIFQLGLMTIILSSVLKDNPEFTSNEILIYYLFVTIVSRITFDYTHERLVFQILNGDFSKHLLRPNGYLPIELGETLAGKLIRTLMIIPLLLLLIYLGNISTIFIETNIIQWLFFILAIILGTAISFVMSNLFALLAFYLKQIYGLKALYNNLILILSGEYLPIRLMPSFIIVFVWYLPYRFILSFPIEIIMGWLDLSTLYVDFAIGVFWLLFLSTLTIFLYKKSVLKFESEGI